MQKANRLAQHLSACHTTEAAHQYVAPTTSPPVPEPMELDSTRLSHAPMLHRPTVQFLRYIISQDGIQMDQGKVTVIREWPRPQTVKELQRFLCFANFYR